MNSSSASSSGVGNAVVVSEFSSNSAVSLGTNLTRVQLEPDIHRLSPYSRPASYGGGTDAGSHLITMKSIASRQRPSFLRRTADGSTYILETPSNNCRLQQQSAAVNATSANIPFQVLSGSSISPTEVTVDDNIDEVAYIPRLSTLPKIPGASLRRPGESPASTAATAAVISDDGTVLPPAFTVVLGGIPVDLVHRLFACNSPYASRVLNPRSKNFHRVGGLPAAVVAAPLSQSSSVNVGPLFTPINSGLRNAPSAVVTSSTSNLSNPPPLSSQLSISSRLIGTSMQSVRIASTITKECTISSIQELDESSAAVAELASEQHAVSLDTAEPFDEIEESIQITSA